MLNDKKNYITKLDNLRLRTIDRYAFAGKVVGYLDL